MGHSQVSDRPKAPKAKHAVVEEPGSSIPDESIPEYNSDAAAAEMMEDPSRHNSVTSPRHFGSLGSLPRLSSRCDRLTVIQRRIKTIKMPCRKP